jgi:hypothetical protein
LGWQSVYHIKHCAKAGKGLPEIIRKAEITANDMLQKPNGLTLNELRNHIRQHRPDRIEPLVRLTNVPQSHIIKQDFLHDKDRDGLGQLGTRFHDPQAERDDFSRKKEIDDV